LMRGGSSKGVFLQAKDLPPAGALRDEVILRIFGSPDKRQIDGLGGADVLTSKLAIIGPPSIEGADVDYTFGQVSFVAKTVDYGGNCGNISSAVGPFAVDEGLLRDLKRDASGRVTVRIHNTNTGAILQAEVPVNEQLEAEVEGDVAVAGVPGTGAGVALDFSKTEGSVTGKLLPSGQRTDLLECEGFPNPIEATLLDAGQPTVFLRGSDFFEKNIASCPKKMAEALDEPTLRRVEVVRGAAAVKMGIVKTWKEAEEKSPYTPFVVFVSKPSADQPWDLTATCVFMQQVHKAYPVTGSIATTAAALLSGTTANEASKKPSGALRIGHPSGIMEVDGAVEDDGKNPTLARAALERTARRLMDGNAYIPWSVWPKSAL